MKMSNEEGSSEELHIIIPTPSVNVEVRSNPNAFQILLADYEENKESLSSLHPPSIFMVPTELRVLKPNCFTPMAVSIGPLHRGHKNVQEFEKQKRTALHFLLNKLNDLGDPPEQTLKTCLEKVNDSIDEIRACYAYDVLKSYSDVELAKMMVTDACFILQFIFYRSLTIPNPFLRNSVFHDLILLENQIPFFVLQDIFDCTLKNHLSVDLSLTSILLEDLRFLNPFQVIKNDVDIGTSHDHILGLLHASFFPESTIAPHRSFSARQHKRSAIELDMAGVQFKPNEAGNWPLAMQFTSSRLKSFCHCVFVGNPTLKLPLLKIYDDTEQRFRNLIAYEQCKPNAPSYFSSYASAMDMLVDTADDIRKLGKSKVIINTLGSDEDATNMINGLCTRVIVREFYYAEQWLQVDSYCNSYWPKHIARLKRTYFNSPWNIIALIAGFILFSLTLVQTIFAIKGG